MLQICAVVAIISNDFYGCGRIGITPMASSLQFGSVNKTIRETS
jgi:hypothetical protein